MSDLDTKGKEKEDQQDSKADAIAWLLIITVLTIEMYFWVSIQ